MKAKHLSLQFLVATSCLALGTVCDATTIEFTVPPGPAIVSPDRTATFDAMTSSGNVSLDTYSENKLSITTASSSWGSDPPQGFPLDPFHGADGSPPIAFYAMANASNIPVTIRTTDSKLMFGVEFMYGNTWTTGQTNGPYPWGNSNAVLMWETWKGGAMVSSGDVPSLAMGTVVGFSDPDGFDHLLIQAVMNDTVGCPSGETPPCTSPPWQAIALDNLNVQLSPAAVPGPVVGGGLPGLLAGFVAMLAWYRKRGAAV